MKIWLTSDNVDWNTERYHYAAEQMMLTLFPGEKPEYPETPVPTSLDAGKNAVIFTLHRGKKLTNMSALLLRSGRWNNGVVRFDSAELDKAPEEVYHTVQRAVKQAFYKAGTMLLGHDLPWGSLTGVRPTKLPTRTILGGAAPKEAKKELEATYHVSPLRAQLATDCAGESVKAVQSLAPDEISLYIGIPFCPSRCIYCSFISAAVDKCLPLVEPFTEALCREIEVTGQLLQDTGRTVRTVYMGGGTPTTLSAGQLDKVLSAVEAHIDLSRCSEFTVEAGRPDSITQEKLDVLREAGVDRVSVNPQTMSDSVLAAIGRSHCAQDVRSAYRLARDTGFDVVNMDLIAGLPTDTPEGFRATLEEVLELAPENITVHTLSLKRGAEQSWQAQDLPDGPAVAGMLDFAWPTLRARGYRPYYLYRQKFMSGALENVGWCRPGYASVYNICMMEELHPVLALGAGGITKQVGDGEVKRLGNPKYPQEYLRALPRILEEKRAWKLGLGAQ